MDQMSRWRNLANGGEHFNDKEERDRGWLAIWSILFCIRFSRYVFCEGPFPDPTSRERSTKTDDKNEK